MEKPDDPEFSGAIPSATVAAAAVGIERVERRRRTDREIVQLAWPAVLSQMLVNFVSLIDIAMLGRLGTEALACVGYTTQFYFLAQSCLLALGIACVAQMARAIGAGEASRARAALATAIVLAVVASLVITAVVIAFPRELILLLGASPEVAERAVPFFRLTLGSTTVLGIALMFESGFRAARNTRTPLFIALCVTAVKLALNGLLIFGALGFPRLELLGAGLATLGAQLFAVSAFLFVTLRAKPEISRIVGLSRADFAEVRALLPETLRLATPALGERVLMNLALMTYFWVLSDYGPVAIAAYTIGVRVLSFSWIPGIGLSVAASTLVGQALGAGDVRGAVRAGWRSARLALLVALVLGVCFGFARLPLSHALTNDAAVIATLGPFMLMLALAQPFLCVHFTVGGALRGAGDTLTPLWAATVGNWVFRVPLAVIAAKLLGADVVWVWACLVSDHITRAAWVVWAFRSERWVAKSGA